MVALLDEGVTEAAWVLQPAHDRLWVAARGQGVTVDGVPVRRAPAPSDPGELRGIVKTRYVGGTQAELLRRSEAHTSELQSLMRISYAVFCLKKKIPSEKNMHCSASSSDCTRSKHHNSNPY